MKAKFVHEIVEMYSNEYDRLEISISNAHKSGDIADLVKQCERKAEMLLMCSETFDIINRNIKR